MPEGAYRHDDGTVEAFRCAAGPAGWRYVGTTPDGRVDLTVDSRWRQVRVEVTAGGWVLRGGVSGADTGWVRAAASGASGVSAAQEHSARAGGFFGRSPAFLVATARALGLVVGGTARVLLQEITEPALGVRGTEQEWALTAVDQHPIGPSGGGILAVQQWRIAEVATGAATTLHLCGDIVLAGPGVELTGLSSDEGGTRT